eukprot:NODE_526_length_6458_cov_1.113854.p1 type:complete len:850 gc:universal NODE_526_length_6458_cov_1.113854:858-3407(+)
MENPFDQVLADLNQQENIFSFDKIHKVDLEIDDSIEHKFGDFELKIEVGENIAIHLYYLGTKTLGVPLLFHLSYASKESGVQHGRLNPVDNNFGYDKFCLFQPSKLKFELRTINDPTNILYEQFQNYQSRLATGCIGLNNQGATCYMNSLLQSLYHTNNFRKKVYEIDTTQVKDPKSSLVLALQRLFYKLQRYDDAVDTNELTASFGWHHYEAFQQHDIQELLRVISDHIEEHLKKLEKPNFIKSIFGGTLKSYIKCLTIDYTSEQFNPFYDLQLQIKENGNLDNAFKQYLVQEMLDGENQYSHEGKKYDAHKGLMIYEFPEVLHLQLIRFEYDFQHDAMIKLNDYFEYPNEMDVLPYLDQTSPQYEQYKDIGLIYELYAVMVHSGDVNHGHYYAFVKYENKWLRCDDERVTIALNQHVFQDNFGSHDLNTRTNRYKRNTNAYMLVYFRKNMLDEIVCPVNDIPKHVKSQVDLEMQHYLKEKAEQAHFQSHVTVLFFKLKDVKEYKGVGLLQISHPFLPTTPYLAKEVTNETTFASVLQQFSNEESDMVDVKPYYTIQYINGIWRPIHHISENNSNSELGRYCEPQSRCVYILQMEETRDSENGLLMFFKYYDGKSMCYLHYGYYKSETFSEIIEQLTKRFDLPSGLSIYEEPRDSAIDPATIVGEIIDSDGNVFVLSQFPIAQFLNYQQSLLELHVSHKSEKGKEFKQILSSSLTYDSVANIIGKFENCDPSFIRIYAPDFVRRSDFRLIKPRMEIQYDVSDMKIEEFEQYNEVVVTQIGQTIKQIVIFINLENPQAYAQTNRYCPRNLEQIKFSWRYGLLHFAWRCQSKISINHFNGTYTNILSYPC